MMEFDKLIFHLEKKIDKDLPGNDSHQKMQVDYREKIKFPFIINKAKPAAVLLLLYPNNDQIFFYLTKRSTSLKYHKGQISLPGGSKEKDETTKNKLELWYNAAPLRIYLMFLDPR